MRRRVATVAAMSITYTADRLQRDWERHVRTKPPWQTWADHHPVLAVSPPQILARLADPTDPAARPTLAALVELAVGGDQAASMAVTFTLLPQMFAHPTSRDRDVGWCEEIAARLWEAVVTASNPQVPTLREVLRRHAWRRFWAARRSDGRLEPLADHHDRPGRGARLDDDTIAAVHLADTLDRLAEQSAISPVARRILAGIATDHDHRPLGQSAAAARKQRWRTTTAARACPGLYEALIA